MQDPATHEESYASSFDSPTTTTLPPPAYDLMSQDAFDRKIQEGISHSAAFATTSASAAPPPLGSSRALATVSEEEEWESWDDAIFSMNALKLLEEQHTNGGLSPSTSARNHTFASGSSSASQSPYMGAASPPPTTHHRSPPTSPGQQQHQQSPPENTAGRARMSRSFRAPLPPIPGQAGPPAALAQPAAPHAAVPSTTPTASNLGRRVSVRNAKRPMGARASTISLTGSDVLKNRKEAERFLASAPAWEGDRSHGDHHRSGGPNQPVNPLSDPRRPQIHTAGGRMMPLLEAGSPVSDDEQLPAFAAYPDPAQSASPPRQHLPQSVLLSSNPASPPQPLPSSEPATAEPTTPSHATATHSQPAPPPLAPQPTPALVSSASPHAQPQSVPLHQSSTEPSNGESQAHSQSPPMVNVSQQPQSQSQPQPQQPVSQAPEPLVPDRYDAFLSGDNVHWNVPEDAPPPFAPTGAPGEASFTSFEEMEAMLTRMNLEGGGQQRFGYYAPGQEQGQFVTPGIVTSGPAPTDQPNAPVTFIESPEQTPVPLPATAAAPIPNVDPEHHRNQHQLPYHASSAPTAQGSFSSSQSTSPRPSSNGPSPSTQPVPLRQGTSQSFASRPRTSGGGGGSGVRAGATYQPLIRHHQDLRRAFVQHMPETPPDNRLRTDASDFYSSSVSSSMKAVPRRTQPRGSITSTMLHSTYSSSNGSFPSSSQVSTRSESPPPGTIRSSSPPPRSTLSGSGMEPSLASSGISGGYSYGGTSSSASSSAGGRPTSVFPGFGAANVNGGVPDLSLPPGVGAATQNPNIPFGAIGPAPPQLRPGTGKAFGQPLVGGVGGYRPTPVPLAAQQPYQSSQLPQHQYQPQHSYGSSQSGFSPPAQFQPGSAAQSPQQQPWQHPSPPASAGFPQFNGHPGQQFTSGGHPPALFPGDRH